MGSRLGRSTLLSWMPVRLSILAVPTGRRRPTRVTEEDTARPSAAIPGRERLWRPSFPNPGWHIQYRQRLRRPGHPGVHRQLHHQRGACVEQPDGHCHLQPSDAAHHHLDRRQFGLYAAINGGAGTFGPIGTVGANFSCSVPSTDGQFVLPSDVAFALPATTAASGYLSVQFSNIPPSLTIPGTDFGFLQLLINQSSLGVTFQ